MTKQRHHQINKSSSERRNYHSSLNHSVGVSPAPTINSNNVLLQGSNESVTPFQDEEKDNNSKTIPTPVRYKFWFWIKENAFSLLFVTIVFGTLAWLIPNFVGLKEAVAEIRTKCIYLERDISRIDSEDVERDSLEKELELITLKLERATIFSVNSLERRIDSLEYELRRIQDNNSKQNKGDNLENDRVQE